MTAKVKEKKEKEKNIWSFKQIRKCGWDTAFKKGKKNWIRLVAIAFLFSFIGAASSFQTMGINIIDGWIKSDDAAYAENVEYLTDYVKGMDVVQKLDDEDQKTISDLVESSAQNNSWVVRVLASNASYFKRNPGEVIANLIVVALIMFMVKFFFQNVVTVGMCRYCMEYRQQKEVKFRRLLAPFHLHTLGKTIWVMFVYNVAIVFWYMLFIIPGIIKTYQYCLVPYIVAENPEISWRKARKLSKQMTKGYKFKIFLTDLSYFYIHVLQLLPIVGLLVSVPLDMCMSTEYYFTLRNRAGIDMTNLPERAFEGEPYVKKANIRKGEKPLPVADPEYVLKDLNTSTAHRKERFKLGYSPIDVIYMFFCFCLIGYVWEVSYEFVHSGHLCNRGTMYGPWIPIYGFGGLAIVLLLDRFKDSKIKLFCMTMIVCAILEYIGSFALEFIFNSSYWDYKKMFMNVNGRICLAGLLAFGIGGLFGVYIAGPAISRAVARFPKKIQRIGVIVLCTLFVIDIVCCILFGFNKGSGVGGKIA